MFLAGAGTAVALAAAVASVWVSSAIGDRDAWTFAVGAGLPMALVGVVLAARRPGNPLGWVMAVSGLAVLTGDLSAQYATYALVDRGGALPFGRLAAWYGGWFWLVWGYGILVFIPLLFPTGRPPQGRWRILFWTALVGLTMAVVGGMFQAELDLAYSPDVVIANPVGFFPFADVEDGAGMALILSMLVHGVLAMASLVVRYRRSVGEERLQLRWVTTAAVVLGVGFMLNGVADAVLGHQFGAVIVLPSLIPIAVGVAVLRYRLYEIDRLISRTVSYVVVVAVLAAAYLGSIVVVQSVVSPLTSGSDLAVAVSTLFAAGLFRPVASRVRRTVERRFDRRRYDAARIIEGFGSRLRDEVDLALVAGELQRTATGSLGPRSCSVWLRPEASG